LLWIIHDSMGKAAAAGTVWPSIGGGVRAHRRKDALMIQWVEQETDRARHEDAVDVMRERA
jgi:hypothetical protein